MALLDTYMVAGSKDDGRNQRNCAGGLQAGRYSSVTGRANAVPGRQAPIDDKDNKVCRVWSSELLQGT